MYPPYLFNLEVLLSSLAVAVLDLGEHILELTRKLGNERVRVGADRHHVKALVEALAALLASHAYDTGQLSP